MTEKGVAPKFVELAHRIVWCSAASVDTRGRPFTRILHPIRQWDGARLNWTPTHTTVQAECRAEWFLDLPTRERVWNLLKNAPAPVVYEPAITPGWTSPAVDALAALGVEPFQV